MGNRNLLWCYSFSQVLNVTKTDRKINFFFFSVENKSGIHVHQKCVRCNTLCLLYTVNTHTYIHTQWKFCLGAVKMLALPPLTHLVQDLITLQWVTILLLLPRDTSILMLHIRVARGNFQSTLYGMHQIQQCPQPSWLATHLQCLIVNVLQSAGMSKRLIMNTERAALSAALLICYSLVGETM